eukprot:358941-Chlamydomonas_euryale.AAC.2
MLQRVGGGGKSCSLLDLEHFRPADLVHYKGVQCCRRLKVCGLQPCASGIVVQCCQSVALTCKNHANICSGAGSIAPLLVILCLVLACLQGPEDLPEVPHAG